jgi:hypothetical protein
MQHASRATKRLLQPLTATWRCLARTFGALTTSIPAISGGNGLSPLQQPRNELLTEASSGAICRSDQSARGADRHELVVTERRRKPPHCGTHASPGELPSKPDAIEISAHFIRP